MTTVKAQILKLQFHQPESAYVEFDFLLSRGASIGVYGRKNAVPTLTQNDLREVIAGVRARNGRDAGSSNQARTSNFGHSASGIKRFIYQIFQFCFMSCGLILRIPQLSVAKTASYFLPSGHWFLSLYNDDGGASEVSFVARVVAPSAANARGRGHCPQGCSGRGECVLGKCQCHAGFDGPDCGQSK